MSGYRVGEHVQVTIAGIVREVDEDLLLVEYAIEGDIIGEAPIVPVAQAVTIERVAPAEWPPKHNDLWKDRDGLNWVANSEDDMVELYSAIGVSVPEDALRLYGPLTLVHREQLQVTPAPDDPVISQDCWQQQHTSCVGCDCPCHCESDGGEPA